MRLLAPSPHRSLYEGKNVKNTVAGLAVCILVLAAPCGFAQAPAATSAGSFGLLVETDSFTVADLGVLYYPLKNLAVGSGLYLGWSNQNDPQIDTQFVLSPFVQYHFLTREALTLYGGGFIDLDWQRSAIASADSSASAVELRLGAMAGLEWYPVEVVSLGVRYRGYLRVHWDVSSSMGTSTSTSDTYFFLAPYPEFVLTFHLPPRAYAAATAPTAQPSGETAAEPQVLSVEEEPAQPAEGETAAQQEPPPEGEAGLPVEEHATATQESVDGNIEAELAPTANTQAPVVVESEKPLAPRLPQRERDGQAGKGSSRTRGNAFDITASYCPLYRASISDSMGSAEAAGWFAGATLSYSYQFNNWISAGFSLHNAFLNEVGDQHDTAGGWIGGWYYYAFSAWLGPSLIIGDKTQSFAGLLGAGAGFTNIMGLYIPVRLGLYYRNFYLGCLGEYHLSRPARLAIAVEAGYSFFFETRRE